MSEDLNDSQLSTSAIRHIDRQCDDFECVWNSGVRPRIEDFVAGHSEPESSHLFRELLKVDVECRMRVGSDARLSEMDYRHRYPDRSREISDVFLVSACDADSPEFASTLTMDPENTPHQIDKYELLNRIGRGGMGEVYRARHLPLNRIVAMKLINVRQIDNPLAVARFKLEIRAVGKLNHPNVVNAIDGGEMNGTHYLVMELVDGIDLAKILRRLGRLSIGDACEIIRQAALGMTHAHESGLIHRDLKPSNLMLDKHGQVKVLDMGLARLLDSDQKAGEIPTLTRSGQAMGTPEYMAPEQATNRTVVDERVDIYSLGCTLYEFLAGQPPFPKSRYETPLSILIAQVNEPLPPVDLNRPELPGSLVGLVGDLLRKNPNERPASMDELILRLEPFAKANNLVALLSRARQYPVEGLTGGSPEHGELVAAESIDETPRLSRRWLLGTLTAGGVVFAAAMLLRWSNSETDLLSQVDLRRDRMRGDWRLDSRRLISPRDGVGILHLPHRMPDEFDIEAVVDRQYGLSLSIIFLNKVTPFYVRFGADVEVSATGANRKNAEQDSKTVLSAGWPLHRQEATRLRIELRKQRLLVQLNDEQPVEWTGDRALSTKLTGDLDPQREGLYLRTDGSEFHFWKFRIFNRTGQP